MRDFFHMFPSASLQQFKSFFIAQFYTNAQFLEYLCTCTGKRVHYPRASDVELILSTSHHRHILVTITNKILELNHKDG